METEETLRRLLAAADEARSPEDHARAVAELEDSLPLADRNDPLLGAGLRIRLARGHLLLGNPERAEEAAAGAIAGLRRTAEHGPLAAALSLHGRALDALGRTDDALRAHEDAVALARLTDDQIAVADAETALADRLRRRARFREAAVLFENARARYERRGDAGADARASVQLAACRRFLGEWDRAIERAERAIGLADAGDAETLGAAAAVIAAIARARGGTPEEALDRAVKGAGARPMLPAALRGDLALASGNADEAESHYCAWYTTVRRTGSSAAARLALARVALARGDEREIERHADAAEADAEAHGDRYALADVHAVRARLHLARDARDAAAAEADEAVRGFRAVEAPYETARALELLALAKPVAEGAAARREARVILRSLGATEAARPAASSTPVEIPTEDPAFRELLDLAARLGEFAGSVLIEGEPGTERRDLAQRICAGAGDCAPATISGAALSPGRVERAVAEAAGGTLVLDETDHLELPAQAALLRALEAADDADASAPRVVAIASRPLAPLEDAGSFLPDLRLRLSGMVLRVPPLRERPADVDALARRFANGPIEDEALDALRAYDWPGNVVELRNALRAARFLAKDAPIAVTHLPQLSTAPAAAAPPGATFPEQVAALETSLIRAALRRTGGNKMAAAKLLGVSRKGLIDRLKRLDLWDEFGGRRRR